MNELTWADIDFNLIQPGMITGGGQEGEQQTLVSFAEYLNVYADTLKHRYSFFDPSNASIHLLEFTRGDIGFKTGYRGLCYWTFNMLRWRTFYSIEILDDPVNADDYKLPNVFDEDPETGFAAYLGLTQEEYELILRISINSAAGALNEIFTARMLRIIFDVFTKYTISSKDYGSNWTRESRRSPWIAGPIEDNTLTRDVSETWVGLEGERDESLSVANNEAYDNYSNDFRRDDFINRDAPQGNAEDQISFRRVTKDFNTFGDNEYRVAYRSIEGHSLVWSYKNRDKEFVDVQFSMYGILRSNHNYVSESNTSPPTPDGKFISGFPELRERLYVSGVDEPPINVSIESMKANSELTEKGVITTYSLSANYPVEKMPQSGSYTDGGFDSPQYEQQFWLTSPMFVYADVNSEGFDYYVDPELWPADP